jgi:DNA-binding MarR family transcriptional regulator
MQVATPEGVTASLQRFGLERDRMRAALASLVGISATDLDALEHLEADGPLTQRQLGERLSLTSGGTTVLVDRLEQAGWVRRSPHPSDRRSVLVELSSAALDQSPAGLVAYHEQIRAAANDVPAEHREVIRAFLVTVAGAASAAAEQLRH